MVIGSVALLRVFPFDFTHLADALTGGLRFLFAWVPDWLGRVALALQVADGSDHGRRHHLAVSGRAPEGVRPRRPGRPMEEPGLTSALAARWNVLSVDLG